MSELLMVYRRHTINNRQTLLSRCRVQRLARRWFFGRRARTSHGEHKQEVVQRSLFNVNAVRRRVSASTAKLAHSALSMSHWTFVSLSLLLDNEKDICKVTSK